MSLQWDDEAEYNNFPNNKTGSLYTCRPDGSEISIVGNTGVVSSITIGSKTVLDDENKEIKATLNLNDHTTWADPQSGMKFRSIKISLKYIGYKKYHPKDENHASLPETRNALIFSIGTIERQVTLANGEIYTLSDGELGNIIDFVKSTTASSKGYLALLPTNALHSPVNTSSPGLDTSIPNETVSVCFLAGTEIKTPEGNRKIEDLIAGEYVIVRKDGEDIAKKIINVSSTHVTSSGTDNGVVRIKANAIAENIPYNDLCVTEDHCIFLDGYLIPARMLVNHNSIINDYSRSSYLIYHLECQDHSIIYANGLFTETYLDTGHKTIADSNIIKIGTKTWEADAAAPLGVKREIAESIWKNILNRSNAMFLAPQTTDDPNLCLHYNNSTIIRPHRINKGYYSFFIPSGIRSLWIKSRSSRPSDVIGPFVDDRRNLGVLVDDICLFHDNGTSTITTPFQDTTLTGWHKIENSQCRWTDGAAYLPIEWSNSTRILSIHVANAGPYLMENEDRTNREEITDIALSA